MQRINKMIELAPSNGYRAKAGLFMIFSGIIIFADVYLKTGWLSLLILPALGAYFMYGYLFSHKPEWMIPGALVGGAGIGSFLALTSLFSFSVITRIGLFLMLFGLGFYLVSILAYFVNRRPAWWALIPGGVVGWTGAAFLFSPLRVLDFVLYVTLGLAVSFLTWGLISSIFGLIIPGSLLVTMGPGIYAAWARPGPPNGLSQTGMMLVCFALGWGLITVLSRRLTLKFVWWPLIPGGVLAMVGWGLYIGGNPGNAMAFIGNTGSIGLILFGAYLLLLRQGIHH